MTTPTFTPPVHPVANIERQIHDVEDDLAHAYSMDEPNQAEIQDLEFELTRLHDELDRSSMQIYK